MAASKALRTRVVASPKSELDALLRQMPAKGSRSLVTRVGGAAVSVIRQRTLAGVDMNGKPFAPYSRKPIYVSIEQRPAGYPKPRGGRAGNKRDRKAKSRTRFYSDGYGQYKAGIGRGSKPQLSVSNRMLGAISISTPSSTTAALFFSSREEAAKAHGHQFGTTTTKREFFGLESLADENALKAEALRWIRDAGRRSKLEIR